MAEVLVIKLSALGDLVQADGAMRDIRAHHHGDRITVMTTPSYRKFMEKCPWVDKVLIDPRAPRYNLLQMARLRREFRAAKFDRVYDLQQVGRTRFYYRRLFPPTQWLGDVSGCWCHLDRGTHQCAADHFAAHLKKAGIEVTHTLHSDVSWMAEDVGVLLDKEGLEPGYVLLIPGASESHPEKRWPHYRDLAYLLIDNGHQVVTVPGPDEMALCSEIPGKMLAPSGSFYDFFTLAGIARNAGFVVGNDTGPTHIAAHLGVSGLALFSSHALPSTTGIQHSGFSIMHSPVLADLGVEPVWREVNGNI